MKIYNILFAAILILSVGCASDSKEEANNTQPAATNTPSAGAAQGQSESMIGNVNFKNSDGQTQQIQPQQIPPPAEPPQNADGVWHFTCPNGCDGGAGAAQPCASCGTKLVHNVAYHNNGATPAPGQAQPAVNGQPAVNAQPMPQPAAPAQNAAGVWHYSCPTEGCGGGAGGQGNCPKCGATLKHNTTYHNN